MFFMDWRGGRRKMASSLYPGKLIRDKRLHFSSERTIASKYFEDSIFSTLASMDY